MKIATIAYKQCLTSRGLKKKAWSFLRNALIKLFNDPPCSLPIHGSLLKLPLSHKLPFHLKNHHFYDRLPRRISEYIHQKYGNLNCIDVGANIGDTIASFYMEEADTFLAIEPNPPFHKLLLENWGRNKNVTFSSDICSNASSEEMFAVQEKGGTASVIQVETGLKMRRRPLDKIVNDYPFAPNTNVIKVDTDGHDFEVIEGAAVLLAKCLPVVLFECDPFGNTEYVENCLRTLQLFKKCGYKNFLLYDNYGRLMGMYSLSDLSAFRNLLFYQLTTDFCYFDVLVVKNEDIMPFYKAEINYFAAKMSNKSLQRTAIAAVGL